MQWQYRVMRIPGESAHGVQTEPILAVVESHFENGETERPVMYGSADLIGDDLEELRRVLQRMLAALDKPILDAPISTEPRP